MKTTKILSIIGIFVMFAVIGLGLTFSEQEEIKQNLTNAYNLEVQNIDCTKPLVTLVQISDYVCNINGICNKNYKVVVEGIDVDFFENWVITTTLLDDQIGTKIEENLIKEKKKYFETYSKDMCKQYKETVKTKYKYSFS